ncbi:hypothetical protein K493DRAFT_317132 [Basidiobolus meristosporus CBS 931.73]|uniref:Cyclin N-terminal domain-containing protein n=1 Tax=Basidiobolus meristosporus CBS 931.73 TaxID=1314790 RepID=A0A1Y1Y0Y4_9FUNG|nr:hypothetical protein K493DRAFT_317132 [Basidiobolus meristosporus CBS 931.73]|eukprot:ORX91667.1 hypothetical protein K493DRAFT_317132 [Basidiobolus meristosporus CBS 931.73]
MAEFAANVVSYLWTSPNFTSQRSGPIVMQSSSRLKESFANILLSLEVPTVVVVLAVKYLYRLRLSLNPSNPSADHLTKLFVTSLLISSKYHLDVNIRNSEWSGKVGIAGAELTMLERWLLGQFRYDLGVTYRDFLLWVKWLSRSWNLPTNETKCSTSLLGKIQNLQHGPQCGNLSPLSELSLLASLSTLARVYQG